MRTIAIDIREAISDQPAGKGIYNLRTTEQLILEKNINWVLISDKPTDLFQESENVKIIVIDKQGLSWHFAVKKYLKQSPVDHYFAPTSFLTPYLIKTPFSIVVHDLICFLYPGGHNFKARFIEKFTLPRVIQRAQHIFAVSENTKKDLLKMFPKLDGSKVSVTKCGVDTDYFTPSSSKKDYILTVSTIIPRKNTLRLIKAFESIKDRIPHDLYIAGGAGKKSEPVFEYVKDHDLEDRVKFLGYTPSEDLKTLYAEASLFVYPSLYEGFGIPVLEAMASGTQVACSNTTSLPEAAGDAAVMFDPEKVSSISAKILLALKDQNLDAGLAHAKKFSWQKVASSILQAL